MSPWLLLLTPAIAQEAGDQTDFRSYLDQARFFLKKDWYDDAAEQLELAVATADGAIDPEAWFLLAKVRFELCDLPGARFAAERALVNSRDDEQQRQTRELLDYLTEKFGTVTLTAPHGSMATQIDVQLTSTIFDPSLKTWLSKLQGQLTEDVALPTELGLPAGVYAINGAEVEVLAGQNRAVEVPILGAAPATLQTVEVEVGVGATAWLGASVANLLPAPTTELSVGLPLGAVRVGGILEWVPTPYLTAANQIQVAAGTVGAGLRIGAEVPGTQPLVVRPSLTWRYTHLPGIEIGCAQGDGEWTCFSGDTAPTQLIVYTAGRMHVPGAELALLYQDRSRSSGLGLGLKASGGYALGRLPAADTAQRLSDQGPIDYRVDAATRPVQAVGIRVLATVSYAF